MTVVLTTLHYVGCLHYVLFLLGLPIEVYYGTLIFLLVIKLIIAIRKVLPQIRRFYISLNRAANRLDLLSSQVDKTTSEIFKPGKGQKRSVSYLAYRSGSSFINKTPLSYTKVSIIGIRSNSIISSGKPDSRNLFNKFWSSGIRSLIGIKTLSAMTFVKRGLPMVNHILRMCVAIGISVNLSWVKVTIVFLSNCNKIRNDAGMKMLVIYLKACFVLTQQASGGMVLLDMSPLGTRFKRTSKGLPKIIPALHRSFIREGNPLYIKFWLTLFSLYRILDIPFKLKLQSITDPSTMDSGYVLPMIGQYLPVFIKALIKRIGSKSILLRSLDSSKGPLWLMSKFKATPFMIPKSSPMARAVDKWADAPTATSPIGLILASKTWLKNPELYAIFKDWCTMTGSTWLLNRIELWSNVPKTSYEADAKFTPVLGRIGFKVEPAGKLRNFALVDPFTQWIFNPLWKAILDILSKIPQDGTLDQMKPIKRLLRDRPQGPYYSYDLSAATDRLPVVIQAQILAVFLGTHVANMWKTLLVGRPYVARNKELGIDAGDLYYAAGQPMGALTSWGMLAFTHHFLVQWSAHRAEVTLGTEWFEDYAILGDDIVIANKHVASEYVKVCAMIGVEIGLAKSLLSRSGKALEFAKRTFVNSKDVSAVPFKEYWVSIQMTSAAIEFAHKYNISLPGFLKLHGAGWRILSGHMKPFSSIGKQWRNLLLAYISPSGVSPRPLLSFILSKSVNKIQNLRDDTKMEIYTFIIKNHIKDLLKKVDSDLPVFKEINKLITVTKYYGSYDAPTAPPAIQVQGITYKGIPSASDYLVPKLFNNTAKVAPIIEDICNIVYRAAYQDVLIDMRNIRNKLEEILASPNITISQLDAVILEIDDLFDHLSLIPLPTVSVYFRKGDAQVKLRSFSDSVLWLKANPLAKATRARFIPGPLDISKINPR